MLVGLPLVPSLVALAIVTTRRVLAVLAAYLGCFDALVNIVAGLTIGQQLVARVALAIEASRRIHAFVSALIQFDTGALVDVAMHLVTLVNAVRFLIAHQLRVNAVALSAHKVLRIRTCRVLSFRR